ncbi:MAG: M14 family zinc carboxypeptidase [Planctomycetota bacterium]|jgi:hypothetical protein
MFTKLLYSIAAVLAFGLGVAAPAANSYFDHGSLVTFTSKQQTEEGVDFSIDANLPAGNIIVEKIDGNDIYLRQNLRDTEGWWFYWKFRVVGAAAKKLNFHFAEPSPIGVRGPAFSKDGGLKWSWLGSNKVKDASFSYDFNADEKDVRFCFTIPYEDKDLQLFLNSIMPNPNLTVQEHTRTKAGRVVQRLRLGKINGEPQYRVLLTCRHHACESMASFVLEGMMEHILTDARDSKWFCDNVEIMAIPFMDMDGVEAGDQGKNRKPRDHNRDYLGESIYNSVRQLRNDIPAWSGGKLKVALDLHCPYIRGDDHEKIYLVGSSNSKIWLQQTRFSSIFESVRKGPLHHKPSDNMPFGQAWNTDKNYTSGKSFCAEVTPLSAKALGRDLAGTLRKYLQELD